MSRISIGRTVLYDERIFLQGDLYGAANRHALLRYPLTIYIQHGCYFTCLAFVLGEDYYLPTAGRLTRRIVFSWPYVDNF